MSRVPRVVIECDEEIAIELDGDVIVPAPPMRMTCECWPGALQIVTGGLDGRAPPS
jgi:diacylglycerol kinase family enzyme